MTKTHPNAMMASEAIKRYRMIRDDYGHNPELMEYYQDFTRSMRTCADPESFAQLMYVVTKLAGEAGEILDEFGKAIRDDKLGEIIRRPRSISESLYADNALTPERAKKIFLESGDLLYYMSELFRFMGWTFDDVAMGNIDKLEERYGIEKA